jgi:hypothetical protein
MASKRVDHLVTHLVAMSMRMAEQTEMADRVPCPALATIRRPQKVLDTLVQSAVRLCDANKAYLVPIEGMTVSWGATYVVN